MSASLRQNPPDPVELSGPERQYVRTDRFRAGVARTTDRLGVPETVARQRILAVFAAARAASSRPPTTLDLHRLLDALVLADLDARSLED